ncbi:MAG: CotH kinase family protein [Bacteroidota bacterium]
MARLFEDPSFEKRVEAKWAELQVSLVAIDSFIDKTSSTLARSQYNNFTKWDILSSYVWPNAIVTGSYKGEVNYLKDWMRKRISWMDSQLTKSN